MSTVEFKPREAARDYLFIPSKFAPAVLIVGAIVWFSITQHAFFNSLMSNFGSLNFRDPSVLIPAAIILIAIVASIGSLFSGIQGYRGVTRYLFDGQSIMIPHTVGSTKIPLKKIDGVNVDELTSHVHTHMSRSSKGKTTTTRTVHYTNLAGENVQIDSGWLPYAKAPYVSDYSGKCLLVRLKNNKCIALTPEDVEGMAKVVSEKLVPKIG